jgi:hypothetical protein
MDDPVFGRGGGGALFRGAPACADPRCMPQASEALRSAATTERDH